MVLLLLPVSAVKTYRDLQSVEVDLKQQRSFAPRYFVGRGVYNASDYPIRHWLALPVWLVAKLSALSSEDSVQERTVCCRKQRLCRETKCARGQRITNSCNPTAAYPKAVVLPYMCQR